MKTSNSKNLQPRGLTPGVVNIISNEVDPAFAARARFIVNGIAAHKPKRVLDIGCGRGYYVKLVSLFPFVNEIKGIDQNPEYLQKARNAVGKDARIELSVGSIYKLPFKDNYFDCVIASEILEHLDDDKMAVKELHRVLKKGGTLLVSVPNKNYPFLWDPLNWVLERLFKKHINKNIWWLAGIWADHERLYSVKEITRLLEKRFSITKSATAISWCWPFSHFLLYGIGKNIVETFAGNSIGRFDFTTEKPVSNLIARIAALPSNLLDKRFPRKVAMNILIEAQK